MMFTRPDRPKERGYASVVLLWLVVALAAMHGAYGAISPSRSLRLLSDHAGTAGQRPGDAAGERLTQTGQQRLVVIADWRGLALKSLLPGGDGGSAIVPSSPWSVLAAVQPCLCDFLPESHWETPARAQRARAPPMTA